MKPTLLQGHERSLTQIKYNRDGDLLFSTSKDKSVSVWFIDNGERLGTFEGHQVRWLYAYQVLFLKRVPSGAWIPTGKPHDLWLVVLISQSEFGTLKPAKMCPPLTIKMADLPLPRSQLNSPTVEILSVKKCCDKICSKKYSSLPIWCGNENNACSEYLRHQTASCARPNHATGSSQERLPGLHSRQGISFTWCKSLPRHL